MDFRNFLIGSAISLLSHLILTPLPIQQGWARPVTQAEAFTAAQAHLEVMRSRWLHRPETKTKDVDDAAAYLVGDATPLYPSTSTGATKHQGQPLAYVVGLQPRGFVVTSPDTRLEPIVAYSFNGQFSFADHPENALPQFLTTHMLGALAEIKSATSGSPKISHFQSNEALWQGLWDGTTLSQTTNKSIKAVTPILLQTLWNQGEPDDSDPYNMFCPVDPDTGGRCYAGCVAVAMAQVINYWQHLPNSGIYFTGSYNSIKDNGTTIPINRSTANFHPAWDDSWPEPLPCVDIAHLLFTCGVALHTDYSHTEGSGAYLSSCGPLLRSWGYSCNYGSATSLPHDTVRNNLFNKWPVLVGGPSVDGGTGHAVVADGWDDNGDYWHINLGWGVNPETTWYQFNGFDTYVATYYVVNIHPTDASTPPYQTPVWVDFEDTSLGSLSHRFTAMSNCCILQTFWFYGDGDGGGQAKGTRAAKELGPT
jgi:hypothetical protein